MLKNKAAKWAGIVLTVLMIPVGCGGNAAKPIAERAPYAAVIWQGTTPQAMAYCTERRYTDLAPDGIFGRKYKATTSGTNPILQTYVGGNRLIYAGAGYVSVPNTEPDFAVRYFPDQGQIMAGGFDMATNENDIIVQAVQDCVQLTGGQIVKIYRR